MSKYQYTTGLRMGSRNFPTTTAWLAVVQLPFDEVSFNASFG
jgi:hypothetical protein